MTLGGGTNLTREPRNGRTFEYMGEDPLLSGTLDGNVMRGEQDQHVIGDIKHYAMNDQESGRYAVNANIDKRSMRESDLLAFEIAIDTSHAAAVMCSYNRVNGDYACENDYLLRDVLKKDFNFQGFVISDWATDSAAKASHAGLDMEQPGGFYYGSKLKKAVESGEVSQAELDDHVFRILRAEFAEGLVDFPIAKRVVDVNHGFEVAQRLAEKSIVLLQNKDGLLPLDPAKKQTIAVIGGHADVGDCPAGDRRRSILRREPCSTAPSRKWYLRCFHSSGVASRPAAAGAEGSLPEGPGHLQLGRRPGRGGGSRSDCGCGHRLRLSVGE